MAPSNTTPWWERKNADAQSRDGGGDACSIRSSETVRGARRDRSPRGIPPSSISSARSLGRPLDARPTPLAPRRPLIPRPQYSCRTAPDDNGVMRRKCERIVKKFRMCPGRCVRTCPARSLRRSSSIDRDAFVSSSFRRSRARGLRFLPALTLPSRPRRAAEPRRRSKTRARRRRKTPKAGSSAAGGPRPGNGVPRRAGAAQEDRRRSCRFRSACSSSSTTTRADRPRKKKRVGVAAAATRARTF
jgi:hypothetical protein